MFLHLSGIIASNGSIWLLKPTRVPANYNSNSNTGSVLTWFNSKETSRILGYSRTLNGWTTLSIYQLLIMKWPENQGIFVRLCLLIALLSTQPLYTKAWGEMCTEWMYWDQACTDWLYWGEACTGWVYWLSVLIECTDWVYWVLYWLSVLRSVLIECT